MTAAPPRTRVTRHPGAEAGRRRPERGGPSEPPRDEQPIGVVIAIGLVALAVAAVLNIDALVRDAEDKPFGTGRDVSLAIWNPVQDVAHVLQLHRPRQLADAALGRSTDDDLFELPVETQGVEDTPAVTLPVAPTTTTIPAPVVRTPTAAAPLEVWFGGDSMSRDPGEAFQRLAVDEQLIDADVDYRISSGLTRPDFFDWPGHLAEVVEDRDPDVMILTFGANDAQGIVTPEGDIYQAVEPGWLDEYRRRVAGTMDLLRAPDRLVVWVGQPVMRDASFSQKMAALNEIYRTEADARPWILFFDTATLLSNPDGTYTDFLPRPDGGLDDVRQGDGIHLSTAGSERLASAVLEVLRDEVDLTPPPAPSPTPAPAETGA